MDVLVERYQRRKYVNQEVKVKGVFLIFILYSFF